MNRRDLSCIALLAAVATIVFSDVLFAGSNFFFRDLFLYHFPMKRIVRDAMLGGEFPFWNWMWANGQPLAANPAYELFYPLQWLILIGSYPFGFAIHILAHIYLALIGMYLLLREMTLGRAAATFGALSFGMGGLLLGSSTMLPTFFVWALAPLVAWSVLRAVRQPAAERLAIAALVAATQLVIGEPVATAEVWLLILIGALFANRRRAVPVIAIVILAATLVAAVQLIPAIDHARDSVRARGLPFSNVREFALPVERPIELVVPHFYGVLNPFVIGYWGMHSFDRVTPYLYSIYNGIAVAILVLAGFILRSRGSLTVALLAATSYVLAIGDRTPLLRALYASGIARGIRYPEKFAAFGVVALTVFAATIADQLLSASAAAGGGATSVRRAVLIASGIVVAISAIPFVWSVTPGFGNAFLTHWQLHADESMLIGVAQSRWLIGFLIAAAATVLVWVLPVTGRRLWLLLAATLMLVDLIPLANELTPRMPASFFTPPDEAASLASDRSAHAVMSRAEWSSYERNYSDVRGALGPWFARNALEPLTPAAWGVRSALELDFDETELLPTHELLDDLMKRGNAGERQWAEGFAWLSNVDTIVDLVPIADVYRQPHDLPHVRIVRLTHVPARGRYSFIDPKSRVTHVDEHPNGATIDVEAATAAPLVVTITRHKYWRAAIDGRGAPLVPANIAYQSVSVPPGRHRIELRYRNPLVIWSGGVSAVATTACFAAIAIAPIRRRRRLRTGS